MLCVNEVGGVRVSTPGPINGHRCGRYRPDLAINVAVLGTAAAGRRGFLCRPNPLLGLARLSLDAVKMTTLDLTPTPPIVIILTSSERIIILSLLFE